MLRRLNLHQRFSDDPERVLATLHKELQQGLNDDLVFALAELSFLHAQNSGDHRHYLASAVYAYTLLYPGEGKARLYSSDPRLRLAYDLYNRGLAESLTGSDEVVMLKSGKRALPFGTLDIASDNSDFYWMGYRLGPFTPSAKLAVRGLRNRYRKPGVGAPLAAGLASQDVSRSVPGASRVPPHIKVPVTAFLRIVDPGRNLVAGKLKGRMELYSAYETPTVSVDGREEPLEFEPTAALAYSLEGAPIYGVEIGGFLSAGFLQSFFPRDRAEDGLFLMHPYVQNS